MEILVCTPTFNKESFQFLAKIIMALPPGPIKGTCAQPALSAAHGLNIPCHNSNLN